MDYEIGNEIYLLVAKQGVYCVRAFHKDRFLDRFMKSSEYRREYLPKYDKWLFRLVECRREYPTNKCATKQREQLDACHLRVKWPHLVRNCD
jgi:hypothetical protein